MAEARFRPRQAELSFEYQILKYKGNFLADHSAYGYLIDPTGKTRLKMPYDMTAEQIAADIRTFLPRD